MTQPKLLALLALSLSLTACSSGTEPSAATAAALVPISQCQDINGTFEKEIPGNMLHSFSIHTKREGDTLSFSFDEGENFFEANVGPKRLTRDGESGSVSVTCNQNSITLVAAVDNGPTYTAIYLIKSETEIEVSGSGSDDPAEHGVYTKREE